MAGIARLVGLTALLAAAPLAGMAEDTSACLDAGGDLPATVAALGSRGWEPAELASPLPPPLADRLIWPLVAVYLAGDSGGATMPEIVALQRVAVEGIARRRDVPEARTRLMTRGEGDALETVLLASVQVTPHLAELSCTFALTDPAAAAPGAQGGVAPARAAREATAQGGFRETRTTALDPSALAARLGAPVPVTAIVETMLRYPSEIPQ